MGNPELILTTDGMVIKGIGNLHLGEYELKPKEVERPTDVDSLLQEATKDEKLVLTKLKTKRGVKELFEFYGKTIDEIIQMSGAQKNSVSFNALIKLLKRYRIKYIEKGGFEAKTRIHSDGKTWILTGINIGKVSGDYILAKQDESRKLYDIEWLLKNVAKGDLKRALNYLSYEGFKNLTDLKGKKESEIMSINGLKNNKSFDALKKFLKRNGIKFK